MLWRDFRLELNAACVSLAFIRCTEYLTCAVTAGVSWQMQSGSQFPRGRSACPAPGQPQEPAQPYPLTQALLPSASTRYPGS